MKKENELVVSGLGHTWLLDLDGTIVKHNGCQIDGKDTFLTGAKEFLMQLPPKDRVVFLTSRTEEYREKTIRFLEENKIRYDDILFQLPVGERILVNDRKPGGLITSLGVNVERNQAWKITVSEDPDI